MTPNRGLCRKKRPQIDWPATTEATPHPRHSWGVARNDPKARGMSQKMTPNRSWCHKKKRTRNGCHRHVATFGLPTHGKRPDLHPLGVQPPRYYPNTEGLLTRAVQYTVTNWGALIWAPTILHCCCCCCFRFCCCLCCFLMWSLLLFSLLWSSSSLLLMLRMLSLFVLNHR